MAQKIIGQPLDPIAKQLVGHLVHKGEKQPGALLLKGDWGVGKTYLWRTHIVPYLGERRYVYVSLFGVRALADLKTRLISGLVIGNSLEVSPGKKLLSLGPNLLRNLPKLLGSGAKSVAKRYLDEDVVAALEVMDLKFDSLQLLPKGLIICFDDVERMALSDDEFLGLVNTLMDQKNARILLIANEEKLEGKYRDFKEKVVWLTLKSDTSVEDVFPHFLNNTATNQSKSKIDDHKEVIFDCFHKSKHKNLRTLQRVIRMLDQVESEVSLDLSRTRFLVALVIEDADKGGLHDDHEVYSKASSYSLWEKKQKKEALTESEEISLSFSSTFFGSGDIVFSDALYRFVKDGYLDELALKNEINPPDTRDAITKLAEQVQSGWVFKTDEEVSALAKKVADTLNSNEPIHIGVVFRLRMGLGRLCRHLEIPVPDVANAIDRRILERALIPDKLLTVDFFIEKEDEDDLQPIFEKYQLARRSETAKKIKSLIFDSLNAGKEPEIYTEEIAHNDQLMKILGDEEILDMADSQLTSSPEIHFRFYQYAIDKIQKKPGGEASELAGSVKNRLKNAKSSASEKGVHRRIEWLLDALGDPEDTGKEASL